MYKTIVIAKDNYIQFIQREQDTVADQYELVQYLSDVQASEQLDTYLRDHRCDCLFYDASIKNYAFIEKLLALSTQYGFQLKRLPSLLDIFDGMQTKSIDDIRVEDILHRPTVKIEDEIIGESIRNKVVFITGAAGSIGSEIARQIMHFSPKLVVNLDINENALYFLELELKRAFPHVEIVTEVGIIREKEKMRYLFEQYHPNIVFHAAAHKHVPLMEHNTEEAVKNNAFGTKNIAELSCEYDVEKFILISTDKAVNPTNIMGATKRLAEMIVEDLNNKSKTKLCAVRFGNVLASNGSVVPIFKELLKNNLNLTLTHKDVTRYFMTIPEAAQLVIAAGALSDGGEVFVLDMGEPVRIYDLAKRMIELSGSKVNIDIVGLRPGEKLYEELLYDVSHATKTVQDKLYIASIESGVTDLQAKLEWLADIIQSNDANIIVAAMKQIVDSYKSPEEINSKRGQ